MGTDPQVRSVWKLTKSIGRWTIQRGRPGASPHHTILTSRPGAGGGTAWRLLKIEGGGSEIENMARHFRKRPAALWLATQEVGEFLSIGHPFPHLVSDGDRAQPCQKWHGGRDKHHVSYQGIDSRFCITREGIAIP
jgi:hypothetical protein